MTTLELGGRSVQLHGDPACGVWAVQLSGAHEADRLAGEAAMLDEAAYVPCCLIAVPVTDWNDELSPWPAAPVFGREGFGGHASATLTYVTEALLPALMEHSGVQPRHVLLAGYSLAGLFALWASTQTDAFDAVAVASPSVWYPGWLDYSDAHPLRAKHVYLSLGDREARTRHPVLSTVADCIRRQQEQLLARGVDAALVWNPGNHFVDGDKRTAAAIAWLLAHACN